MRLKPLVLTLALSLGFTMPALAADAAAPAAAVKAAKLSTVEGITEYTLPNGLRVLLAPDSSKPTTTVNITYLVGSRHENYGETGMAHLLEHMVFKGTATSGNLMEAMGKRGMDFNGTTFMDRTNYYETFPATDANLEWALAMEADRMVNSTILRSELEKEFSVVRNEMESGENNPHLVLWKQMTAVTYDWHNYGKSTIGARADVENVKIENLQNFYRKYYQPDNAVLVVAGKFDPAKTLALIEKNFGAIARPTRVLSPTYTADAARDGARELTVKRIGDKTLAAVLYPTASGSHADSTAIALLGEVLASSPNGRLHKSMVEGKKAVGVSNWALALAEPGYIVFWSELSKTQSVDEARKLMLEHIEGMKKRPVTAEELGRAKASLLNDIDKTINNPQALGTELSESIAMGDWRLFFLNRDRIEAMTLADVQKAAENYFKETNRTFGRFLPMKESDRTVTPATPDVAKLLANYTGQAAVAEGEAFDVSPLNIEKRTSRVTLPNGLKLAFLPKKTRAATVNGQFDLEVGDEKTLFGQSAIADLTADMLMRGAGKMSRSEITTRLDAIKTKLSISGKGSGVSVRFQTSRAKLPEVLTMIGDLLRSPTFPATEFEQLRAENLTAIDGSRNDPQAVGVRMVQTELNQFKKGDIRYVGSVDEAIASYKEATLADAKRFHQTMYGTNNGKFALVGDFDAAQVEAQLKDLFGNWNSKNKFVRLAEPMPTPKPNARQVETPEKANAFYMAALPIKLKDIDPDYATALLVNEVIGGGTQSRLFARLRQKDGISYGAGSFMQASSFEQNGSLGMYAIYAPENLERVKLGIKEELERYVRDGMTATELDEAKKGQMQQRQTSRAQDGGLAAGHVNHLKSGRTFARTAETDAQIMAVTLEQANAAIRKYIEPGKFLHVYAGDFASAAKKAAPAPAAAPAAPAPTGAK
ncbi:M16 family metallopeptidase [Massilia glaciei]|uniref:Insulinase family protein n=1 Tax=Massilia glaciei TaxID=1524097 RepID=A0A2U2HJK0_9BURK|nr:pitrilysin family protein [Massilia glaciei]PWF47586.1 insulinase family protein [Massilia glaciei]